MRAKRNHPGRAWAAAVVIAAGVGQAGFGDIILLTPGSHPWRSPGVGDDVASLSRRPPLTAKPVTSLDTRVGAQPVGTFTPLDMPRDGSLEMLLRQILSQEAIKPVLLRSYIAATPAPAAVPPKRFELGVGEQKTRAYSSR